MNDSKLPRSKIAEHIAKIPKSGIREFFEIVSTMKNVISLGIGEPDFPTPWHIREAAIYGLEQGHTSYTSNLGLIKLREEICKMVYSDFGATYDPRKECLVTIGVSEALDLALRAILNPEDEVIYHQPCYVSYSPSIIMAHAKPVAVNTYAENEFVLNPQDLEKAITAKTKAILLNFPCNPTGANLSFEQKKAIAKIAIKHDLLVLTDEIYAELTYGERSSSIAAIPGMKERTIFLHGFSKAYAMTGFRIGFACGPAEIIDAMMKIHQYSMLCASITSQEAAIEALKNGKKSMEKMRDEYEQRRNFLVHNFNEMGLKCLMPKGAFYIFLDISSTKMNAIQFATQLLKEEAVAVVPGSAFSNDENATHFVRCSYATSMQDLKTAIKKISSFVSRIKCDF